MFLEGEGFHLATYAVGAGARTILAHGGWVGNFELWLQPFELMQDRWRCLAYDHRGSGASDFPVDAVTAGALVDDLFRVLDHFEVDRCVLAGESVGGVTCLSAVLRDPSRFDGLVLVDSPPQVTLEGSKRLVEGSRTDFPATVRWFVDACIPEPDSEHVRRWGRQILLRAEPEAAARLLEAHFGVTPDLEQIEVPTLVVHGERDAIVPVPLARRMAATIPRAAYRPIADAGHVPTLTRPRDVVAAIEAWAGDLSDPSRSGGVDS